MLALLKEASDARASGAAEAPRSLLERARQLFEQAQAFTKAEALVEKYRARAEAVGQNARQRPGGVSVTSESQFAEEELLRGAYRDFNARNIDAVLARMTPDVEWANGMDGGHVYGRDAVRAYWTRQFAMLDPHVDPIRIEADETGRMVVQVHQVVRDLHDAVLVDTIVHHVYRMRGGLIERMDIEHRGRAAE